jgi:hypothetical protein
MWIWIKFYYDTYISNFDCFPIYRLEQATRSRPNCWFVIIRIIGWYFRWRVIKPIIDCHFGSIQLFQWWLLPLLIHFSYLWTFIMKTSSFLVFYFLSIFFSQSRFFQKLDTFTWVSVLRRKKAEISVWNDPEHLASH